MIPAKPGRGAVGAVGHAVGAGDFARARFSHRPAAGRGDYAVLVALELFALRAPIAALYSADANVIAMAASLLGFAAVFGGRRAANHCLGALRGAKLTTAPMLIHTLSFWGHRHGYGRLAGLARPRPAAGWTLPLGAAGFWAYSPQPAGGRRAAAGLLRHETDAGWARLNQAGCPPAQGGFSAVLNPTAGPWRPGRFPLSLAETKKRGRIWVTPPKINPKPYCAQLHQTLPSQIMPTLSPRRPLTALNTFGLVARARRLATLSDEANCPPCWPTTTSAMARTCCWAAAAISAHPTEVSASVLRIATGASPAGRRWRTGAGGGCCGRILAWFCSPPCNTAGLALEKLSLIPGTVGASPIRTSAPMAWKSDRLAQPARICRGRRLIHELPPATASLPCDSPVSKQQAGRWLVLAVRFTLSRRAAVQTIHGGAELRRDLAEHIKRAHPGWKFPTGDCASANRPTRPSWVMPAVFQNRWWTPPAAALLAQWPDLPHWPGADGWRSWRRAG